MTSNTVAEILKQHQSNEQLNTPLLNPMVNSEQDLSAEESLFPLDERIIATSSGAMEEGHTHYVPVPGIDPLREAIADYLNKTVSSSYAAGNVLVTAGMQESRFLTTQLIGEQFENIAVPSVVHPGVMKALGVRPRTVNTIPADDARRLPSVDAIGEALEGGSQLIYLESPSRLTGSAYTADEVAAIADLLKQHDAAVIWDQGFAPWGEDVTSIISQPDMADRTALIGEAFPGMGLASWYIGYITAPEDWIAPMQSQKQIMAICTSTASQYAALEAANLYGETHPAMVARLKEQRSAAVAAASQAGLTVIDGEAVNVIAVELSVEQMQKLTAANGADFGAAGIARLLVNAATADALKQLG